MKKTCLMLALMIFGGNCSLFAQPQVKETVAILKKNLAESKQKIRQYEWIETTTTYIKGKQKSVKQNQCYYAVDGQLTKVETGATTPGKKGLGAKMGENKKEELSDYIKTANAKVQTYLPPTAEKVQQVYNSGKTSIQILEPEKKFKISLPDYNQSGDMLSVSVDKVNQKIMALSVSTYIDGPSDKVVFDATFSSLPDGTQYPGTITLQAPERKLKLVIKNSGFKKGAGR
jgi:hypothetical protein